MPDTQKEMWSSNEDMQLHSVPAEYRLNLWFLVNTSAAHLLGKDRGHIIQDIPPLNFVIKILCNATLIFDILETVAAKMCSTLKYCTFLWHDETQKAAIKEPEIPYNVNFSKRRKKKKKQWLKSSALQWEVA